MFLAFVSISALAFSQDSSSKPLSKESFSNAQLKLFQRLNVASAWKITKGDGGTLIGLVDTGYDFFHPDLVDRMAPGFYYPSGFHTDFYENVAHGTLVAGLIVANNSNTDGVSGLAPNCRIVTASQGMIEHTLIKFQKDFFSKNPRATQSDFQAEFLRNGERIRKFGEDWAIYQIRGAADAIRFLVDRSVKVINISSLLKRSLCPSVEAWEKLEAAFQYAASKDVVLVLAAGNSAELCEDYPGTSECVIVAGATLLNDQRWELEVEVQGMKTKQGSNFGKRLSVMAPVEDLPTCTPHEPRFYKCDASPMGAMNVPFQGPHEIRAVGATSSAAPIVSALVALVRTANPMLDAKTTVSIVQAGCDDIGEKGYDQHTGHGRINFGNTLQMAIKHRP